MNRNNRAGGLGLCSTLTLIFIVLRLVGVIHWPWLWVLSPTWIPTAAFALVLYIAANSGE